MGSLSGPERQDAIYKVGLLCELRRRNRPDDEIAKKLHFGSVEAMHTQLNNWGLPLWLTRDLQRSSEEATGPPKNASAGLEAREALKNFRGPKKPYHCSKRSTET
jgi:hypothetical protein